MITENREAPKVLFTSLQGYPLQRTSRGSSSCVTHQGREGDTPSLVPTVKSVRHR
ncbi:hypothetical protein NIES3787_02090 [Microcystis aeruginosa NIES-3787]|uniref:Uncharacterized protein n=1 Tax=Microcystis aeruginosa NIES-3787 TaxID=2517782 RepID=A0A6H9FIR2_MICAE|nr:hypothetical protein NIES3787_02090 [Microcystis aeruginosa NIES-3787]